MPIVPLGVKNDAPVVSVIIPLHRDCARFRYALAACLAVRTESPYEVVVVSDRPVDLPPEVVLVLTGSSRDTSPAVKRDCAAAVARGSIFAYVDDDAYPRHDWIDRALAVLADPRVQAVGGPGLTPPGSPWRERLAGAVYESRFGSGPLRYRFVEHQPARDGDDLPAYNLFIRREALEAIDGWASNFYGGEDTKACLELVRAGFVLRYDPNVVVYHFRRPVFRAHWRQVGNVGRHRGYFVRRYPATSRRILYFLPAVVLIATIPAGLAIGAALWLRPSQTILALVVLWVALGGTAVGRAGVAAIAFPAALVAHHLAYGWNFLRGLLGPPVTF